MIKITKDRIRSLLLSEDKLERLESLGVDNWDGWSEVDNEDYFDETLDEYEEKLKSEDFILID